jgi:hypothetical protein
MDQGIASPLNQKPLIIQWLILSIGIAIEPLLEPVWKISFLFMLP